MTAEDLKDRVRRLEQTLSHLMEEFKEQTGGCRVAKVRVLDDGPEIHDQEVKVRLDPPQRELKRKRELLERDIKHLLGEFEAETGFRVAEVLGPSMSDVQVRLDPLPYPQRYALDHASEASLSALKVH